MNYVDYHSNATHTLVALVGNMALVSVITPIALRKKYSLAIAALAILMGLFATILYQKLADDNYPDFNHWTISILIAWIPTFLLAVVIATLFPNKSDAPRNSQTNETNQIFAAQANTTREIEDMGYKNCVFCAEKIKAKAIKCRYCGSSIAVIPAKKLALVHHDEGIKSRDAFGHNFNSDGFCVQCGWQRASNEISGRSCAVAIKLPKSVTKEPNNWRAEKAKHKEKIQILRQNRNKTDAP